MQDFPGLINIILPAAFAATASWYTSVTNKISDGLSTPTDSEIST